MKYPLLPGSLAIESRDELDIEEIQRKILKHFKRSKKKRVRGIKKQIDEADKEEAMTVLQKKVKAKKLEELRELEEKVFDDQDMDEFESRTDTIILELQNISEEEERLPLIGDFIDVLGDYIQITETRSPERRKKSSVKNSAKKAEEDQKVTKEIFRKALLRHFSCTPANLPEELFKDLDNYFGSFDHLKKFRRKHIEKVKLLPNGRRKGTDRKLMLQALKFSKNQSYYDRVNVICATYWLWKFPDLSEWEDIIMSDFDETQKVFRDMKKVRQSNLNIQYRLFKHLQARGFPCKKSDFKIISERKILLEYDKMWKYMVENSGIEDLSFIKTT